MSNCFYVNGDKAKIAKNLPKLGKMSKIVVATGFKTHKNEQNPNFSDVVIAKFNDDLFRCRCNLEIYTHGLKTASSHVTLWEPKNRYDVRRECKALSKAVKKAGIVVTPKKDGCFSEETLFNARTYMDIIKSIGRHFSDADECVIVRRYNAQETK